MFEFDFSTFPTLTTPRLILREFAPSDAADLFSFRCDPEVAKYDSDPPMREVAEAATWIEQFGKHYAAKEGLGWAIVLKEKNSVIGDLGFFFWERAYYKADLGYSLARPYWRQGFATEALQAVLQFGFETMRVHRVNADTRMDNLASTRLLEKVGFRHEGVRRECIRNPDGTYQNWGLYGLLEHEYRELK